MNTKRKFNFPVFLFFLLVFVVVFTLLAFIKILYPQITLYSYFNNDFFILAAITALSSIISRKYFFSAKHQSCRTIFYRIYSFGIINLCLLLFVKFFQHETFYGIYFLMLFVLILTMVDLFIVYLYFSYYRSRRNRLSEFEDIESFREDVAKRYKLVRQTKTEIVRSFIGEEMFSWIMEFVDIEGEKIAVYSTSQIVSVDLLPHYSNTTIINFRRINDIARINKYFELVNEKLPDEGLFIGIAETVDYRNKIFREKYIPPINYIVIFLDFLFNRVFPKIKLTQELYFSYTKGNNRPLSKAEVLGRLYSCGFTLVDATYINNQFIFCAKKEKMPLFDNNPTYGPFVALKRIGKDKKEVLIYKMRTMYPYSEYIQKLVYDAQGSLNGDKAENDFRITRWGRFFRRFWLDELPMFINLFKGDVKMVGVRPLSRAKFETYPIELQDKRTKTKPGLVPPFYADMPKSQEELFSSEDNYLNAYFKAPFKTDWKYFWKAVYNIVIKKARSK